MDEVRHVAGGPTQKLTPSEGRSELRQSGHLWIHRERSERALAGLYTAKWQTSLRRSKLLPGLTIAVVRRIARA